MILYRYNVVKLWSLALYIIVLPSIYCHVIVVGGFCVSCDFRVHVIGGNLPLVGFPKANWSWVMSQMKIDSENL